VNTPDNSSVDLKPLIAHVTAMRDGIRTFLVERAALEIPQRSSPLVDAALGGGLAGDAALLAQLADARRVNAALAKEIVELKTGQAGSPSHTGGA
jgi:hypothetical protein